MAGEQGSDHSEAADGTDGDKDQAKAQRVMQAILKMRKIDIAMLETAAS